MSSETQFKVNFYVIHVESFKHRKISIDRLEQALKNDKRFEVQFKYVLDFDPQNITQENIKTSVSYEQIKDEKLQPFNNFLKNMHVNQLSNSLKHKKAIQLISDSEDEDFSIVIEDDVIFNDNIGDNLYKILSDMPENYDVMFLGLPSSKEADGTNYQKVHDVFRVLPCCDSYIVSKKAATILNEMFFPIKFQNNIQLTYLFSKLELDVYLSIPNVFIDGSKLGLYFSTLEVNNRLIFNQDYVVISRLLEKEEKLSENDIAELDSAFADVKLKTNPEFYYLKALYETKKGNMEFAEAIFNYTFELYENNGAILNNQSLFLRDYMRLFKNLQN